MRYDVKTDVFSILRDQTLSKSEKIRKISDLYNQVNDGGNSNGSSSSATGGDTGNSTGQSNNSNGNDQGQNNGSQGGQGQQGGQNGNQGNQNGQGQQNGQGGQQSGQNGNQQNNQQGSQGQGGNQSQQSGDQGQQGSQNGNQGNQGLQNNQNSNNGQGQPVKLDDYTNGRLHGRAYALDMFKHKGMKPVNNFDVPEPDDMVVAESMNESVNNDDELGRLIDDSSLTDDEKVSKIHDIFMNTIDKGTRDLKDALDDINRDKFGGIIPMRNGGVDTDTSFTGNHVIDKTLGDQIRKEVGVVPKDPDWGMKDDISDIKETWGKLIDDVFKGGNADEEIRESGKEMQDKIKGRIIRSREGIINWKRALMKFISMKSRTNYKKGDLRKIPYHFSGVAVKHREPEYTDYNKCVFYIDTSGSVNNEQTQLIPVMIGEIGKVVRDCHFSKVDIHLFNGSVYSEHFDVKASAVQRKDWGIEGASNGGSTSIHSCYRHFIEHYMRNGRVIRDVDAVIIITDVSGVQDSGTVKPFANRISPDVWKKFLYVIYSENSRASLGELSKHIDSYLSSESQYFIIPLEAFKRQLEGAKKQNQNESMIHKTNRKRLNEALGSAKKITDKKAEVQQQSQADRTDKEKEERLRKSAIQGARALGTLDQVLPDLVANLEKYHPDCHMVKEITAVMSTENTYYVTESATVVLNKTIKAFDSDKFIESCKYIDYEAVIGNVEIGNVSMSEFPATFPKQINGRFKITNITRLSSFKNAPQVVTNGLYLDVRLIGSRRITQDMINTYANEISTNMNMKKIDQTKGLRSIFKPKPKPAGPNESLEESVNDAVLKRIMLGESFLNERYGGLLDKPRGKEYGNVDKWDIYNKNREIFNNVIRDAIKASWGDISDKDVKMTDKPEEIRELAVRKSKEGIDITKKGITVFADKDDIISAVTAKDGKEKSKILFLRDANGSGITDTSAINDEVKARFTVFKNILNSFKAMGIVPDDFSEKIGELGATNLEIFSLGHLYQGLLCAAGIETKKYAEKVMYGVSGRDDSFVSKVMNEIFGASRVNNSDTSSKYNSFSINTIEIDGHPVSTLRLSTNPADRRKFIVAAEKSIRSNNIFDTNIFEYLSDEYLRCIIKGVLLRYPDNYPIYDIDAVDNASRDELIDMAYALRDVKVVNTALKSMNFFKESKEPGASRTALLLFPERFSKLYYFDVDVEPLKNKLTGTKIDRDISNPKNVWSIQDFRDELDKVNARRKKNGQKPLTFFEFTRNSRTRMIAIVTDAIKKLNDVSVLKDLRNRVKEIISDDQTASEVMRQYTYIISSIFVTLRYLENYIRKQADDDQISEIFDKISEMSNALADLNSIDDSDEFKKLTEDLVTIYASLENTADEEIKRLAGDPKMPKEKFEAIKKNLIKKHSREALVDTESEKTTKAEMERVKGIYDKFTGNVSDLTANSKKALDILNGLDFTALDPSIIRKIRGGKQGLYTNIEENINDIVGTCNEIATNAGDAKNGNVTDQNAFNWMVLSLENIEAINKMCKDIIDNSDVRQLSMIKDFMILNNNSYQLSVDLMDYGTKDLSNVNVADRTA